MYSYNVEWQHTYRYHELPHHVIYLLNWYNYHQQQRLYLSFSSFNLLKLGWNTGMLVGEGLTYFTLPMPLSPRLLATWLHYHQLHRPMVTMDTVLLIPSSWRSINPLSANFVQEHDSTMWTIVCRSPHWHWYEEVRHHFCRLAAGQEPHNISLIHYN